MFEGDSVVRVVLPAPELCSFQVNHDQSRVFSTENGFFQDADLVDQGYKYAEAQVRTAALQAGILAQTQRNAEQILVPMLRTLTGRRVIVGQQLVLPKPGPKKASKRFPTEPKPSKFGRIPPLRRPSWP